MGKNYITVEHSDKSEKTVMKVIEAGLARLQWVNGQSPSLVTLTYDSTNWRLVYNHFARAGITMYAGQVKQLNTHDMKMSREVAELFGIAFGAWALQTLTPGCFDCVAVEEDDLYEAFCKRAEDFDGPTQEPGPTYEAMRTAMIDYVRRNHK